MKGKTANNDKKKKKKKEKKSRGCHCFAPFNPTLKSKKSNVDKLEGK
jgi:hypothetical protein